MGTFVGVAVGVAVDLGVRVGAVVIFNVGLGVAVGLESAFPNLMLVGITTFGNEFVDSIKSEDSALVLGACLFDFFCLRE